MLRRRFFRLLSVAAMLVPLSFLLMYWSTANALLENKLVNGTFIANGGGWQGATGGSYCWGAKPSLGEWEQNSLSFSYFTNTVTQSVVISNPSELLLTYSVKDRHEPYINGYFNVSISGPSGTATSGWLIAPNTKSQFSLNYETLSPDETVVISISGNDGGIYWAGCYGPSISDVSLVAINEQPPLPEHIYGEAWENSTLVMTAPNGYVFDGVLFSSYGTPNQYRVGSCHAESTSQIVSDVFIGKTTASIEVNNSIFGDPCSGVVKKLVVALTYSPAPATTLPPTPTTIPPVETTLPPVETTLPPVETTLPPVEPIVPPTLPPETTVPAPIPTNPVLPSVPSTAQPITTTTQPIEIPTTTTLPDNTTEKPINIDEVISGGITEDEAVDASSSPELLAELDTSEAIELFSAIDEGSLSDEEAAAIVAAVQGAPEDVREAFEDTIDIFGGGFDDYVMVDSTISVGDRRTMVAVTVVSSAVALSSAPASPQGPRGGNSPSQSPSSPTAKKEEDEEESEPVGEIASDGVDWIKAISIYKEIDGEKIMDWKAFTKKFVFGILNLGFTISGSIVVYFTLSGTIQKIALISTLAAFAAAMFLHMQEPEGE